MANEIPRPPSWCSDCIREEQLCVHHRDANGKPVLYTGKDAYEPTDFVIEVVGGRYTTGDWTGENGGRRLVYTCFGYDPRQGFWMRRVDRPSSLSNVSPRAIGTNYLPVVMMPGAWVVLRLLVELGRVPTAEEAAGWSVFAALERLYHNGFTANLAGTLTELGRDALAEAKGDNPAKFTLCKNCGKYRGNCGPFRDEMNGLRWSSVCGGCKVRITLKDPKTQASLRETLRTAFAATMLGGPGGSA